VRSYDYEVAYSVELHPDRLQLQRKVLDNCVIVEETRTGIFGVGGDTLEALDDVYAAMGDHYGLLRLEDPGLFSERQVEEFRLLELWLQDGSVAE